MMHYNVHDSGVKSWYSVGVTKRVWAAALLRHYREEGLNDVIIGADELAESHELPQESRKFQDKKDT